MSVAHLGVAKQHVGRLRYTQLGWKVGRGLAVSLEAHSRFQRNHRLVTKSVVLLPLSMREPPVATPDNYAFFPV